MSTIIYALKTCDSCKKAIKQLSAAGHDLSVIDVRADGVPREKLAEWLAAHGADVVVNKKSTTWRNLSDDERATDPLDLLSAHPTLLKRPVTVSGETSHVGWGKDVQAHFGV